MLLNQNPVPIDRIRIRFSFQISFLRFLSFGGKIRIGFLKGRSMMLLFSLFGNSVPAPVFVGAGLRACPYVQLYILNNNLR